MSRLIKVYNNNVGDANINGGHIKLATNDGYMYINLSNGGAGQNGRSMLNSGFGGWSMYFRLDEDLVEGETICIFRTNDNSQRIAIGKRFGIWEFTVNAAFGEINLNYFFNTSNPFEIGKWYRYSCRAYMISSLYFRSWELCTGDKQFITGQTINIFVGSSLNVATYDTSQAFFGENNNNLGVSNTIGKISVAYLILSYNRNLTSFDYSDANGQPPFDPFSETYPQPDTIAAFWRLGNGDDVGAINIKNRLVGDAFGSFRGTLLVGDGVVITG